MAATSNLGRKHLDQRLRALAPLGMPSPPHRGWIRAIRDALGMSSTELAARLGVAQSSVVALENSEVRGSIKLDSLRRVAAAMDCEFVYALVPRTSLEESVRVQARAVAARHLRNIAHHSRLEDQEVSGEVRDNQLEELAVQLIDRRGLWASVE